MSNLNIGDTIINFELPATDGKTYTVDSFGESDLLAVIFSCNHCPYVLAWEDRLIAAQNDYADKSVQVAFISANNAEKYPADSFENMAKHAEDKGFPFPYLYDESQDVARAYGAERTPEIFLFDKERTLQYHGTVDDNYEDPSAVTVRYFRDALDAVLAGNAPATASTAPVGCTIKWKN